MIETAAVNSACPTWCYLAGSGHTPADVELTPDGQPVRLHLSNPDGPAWLETQETWTGTGWRAGNPRVHITEGALSPAGAAMLAETLTRLARAAG